MPKGRKPRDLALAPASQAEEIGLEGIGLGWADSLQRRPYGSCPPYLISSYCRTSPCPVLCLVPLLTVSANSSSGMLDGHIGKSHWWEDLLALSLDCHLGKTVCIPACHRGLSPCNLPLLA